MSSTEKCVEVEHSITCSNHKRRAPNFSANERGLLLNIITTFKNVVENKKTDGTTWRLKDETWGKITSIFNSQSSENVSRSKDSLRKYYENLKKNIRKDVAQENKTIRSTGGGPPTKKPKTEDHKDLLLSLISEKTVYGLNNPHDGDAQDVLTEEHGLISEEHSYVNFNDVTSDVTVDIMTESGTEANILEEFEHETPSNILKSKKDNALIHQWTSRRRPKKSTQNKGNELKEEYSQLSKVKTELYKEELEMVRLKNAREQEIHDLNKETFLLEIKKKKLEIKRLEDML